MVVFSACAGAQSSGLFPVDRVETELTRGVSNKADVQRVLGHPNGVGGALFPADAYPREIAHEVWYYLDVNSRIRVGGEKITSYVVPDMLLIFFADGVFDGFMWFSYAGAEEAS
jgi:hypothetical protein